MYIIDGNGNYVPTPTIQGADGAPATMKIENGWLKWSNDGVNWTNLVQMSTLKGDTGAAGTDGREVEMQINGTKLQWRYTGAATWSDLMDLHNYGTVVVGTTTTGDPGTQASVVNVSQDPSNAILNFTIPAGTGAESAFLLYGQTLIPDESDLNDYSDVGSYYCYGSAHVSTLSNCPTTTTFTLWVTKTPTSSYVTQIVMDIYNNEFRRYSSDNGNTWGNWGQVYPVNAVPLTRTVNNKALSTNITLTAADVGARADTWVPTAAQVGAVPTTRTVNSKALSSNITLAAADVGAMPIFTSLSAAGCSTSDTLRQVHTKMPTNSTIVLDWCGKSASGYSGTTFGNELPASYGGLIIRKTNTSGGTWFEFCAFTGNTTGHNMYHRYLGSVNGYEQDTGWFLEVPATRTINGKALSSNITLTASDLGISSSAGTLSYTTSAFTNTGSSLRKYGNVVTLGIAGNAAKTMSANSDNNIMTIPSGYRPAANINFISTRGTNGNYMARGYVNASNGIVYYHPTDSVTSGEVIVGSVTYIM